jgi:hypothetical protein
MVLIMMSMRSFFLSNFSNWKVLKHLRELSTPSNLGSTMKKSETAKTITTSSTIFGKELRYE